MGAIAGPLITGWMMGLVGPGGFWLFVALLMLAIAGYAAYRMTQRAAMPVEDSGAYVGVLQSVSPVALEAAQEWAIEASDDDTETATGT